MWSAQEVLRKVFTAVVTLALLVAVLVSLTVIGQVITMGTVVSIDQLVGFVVAAGITIPFILVIFGAMLLVLKGFVIVGRRLARFTPRRLRTGLKRRFEWDISQSLRSAVIGGVIGGLVFASLSPLVVPVVSDIHTAFNVAAEPEPTIYLWTEQDADDLRTVDGDHLGGRWEDGYRLYRFQIENEDRTPVEDLTLELRFPGCLQDAATDAEMLSSRSSFLDMDPNKISFHAPSTAGYEADCRSTVVVHITDLPHNRKARLFFVVNVTPDAETNLHRERIRPEIDCTFVWEYNGRQYSGGGFHRQAERLTYGQDVKPGTPWEFTC